MDGRETRGLSPVFPVSVAYFQTSDAETAALKAFIEHAFNLQQQGQQPRYVVGFRDCVWFCMNGMQKAGIGNGSSILFTPNYQFEYFSSFRQPTQTATGTDPEEDGAPFVGPKWLKDRDGNCVGQ